MGAWTFVLERLPSLLRKDQQMVYAGRPPSASPAAGSSRIHKKEQASLVTEAFTKEPVRE